VTLLMLIENHLRRTGIAPSRFGREAAGDPRLVHDMRRGRDVRRRLEMRVRAYIVKSGAAA